MSHKVVQKAYMVKLTAVTMLVIMLTLQCITLWNSVKWVKSIEYVKSNVHDPVNKSLIILAVSARFEGVTTLVNVMIIVIMLVVLEGALNEIGDSIIHLVKVSSPTEYEAIVLAEERVRKFYNGVKWVMLGAVGALCIVTVILSVIVLKG